MENTRFKVVVEKLQKTLKVILIDPPKEIDEIERFQIERHGNVLYFAPSLFGAFRTAEGFIQCRASMRDAQKRKVVYLQTWTDMVNGDGTGVVLEAEIVENPQHISKYLQYTHPIFAVTVPNEMDAVLKEKGQKEEQTEDPNLGILMAKISVMSEQINDLMQMAKENRDKVMEFSPYIENWSSIRKALQLWRVEKNEGGKK